MILVKGKEYLPHTAAEKLCPKPKHIHAQFRVGRFLFLTTYSPDSASLKEQKKVHTIPTYVVLLILIRVTMCLFHVHTCVGYWKHATYKHAIFAHQNNNSLCYCSFVLLHIFSLLSILQFDMKLSLKLIEVLYTIYRLWSSSLGGPAQEMAIFLMFFLCSFVQKPIDMGSTKIPQKVQQQKIDPLHPFSRL